MIRRDSSGVICCWATRGPAKALIISPKSCIALAWRFAVSMGLEPFICAMIWSTVGNSFRYGGLKVCCEFAGRLRGRGRCGCGRGHCASLQPAGHRRPTAVHRRDQVAVLLFDCLAPLVRRSKRLAHRYGIGDPVRALVRRIQHRRRRRLRGSAHCEKDRESRKDCGSPALRAWLRRSFVKSTVESGKPRNFHRVHRFPPMRLAWVAGTRFVWRAKPTPNAGRRLLFKS